jgi:hypothetical protein
MRSFSQVAAAVDEGKDRVRQLRPRPPWRRRQVQSVRRGVPVPRNFTGKSTAQFPNSWVPIRGCRRCATWVDMVRYITKFHDPKSRAVEEEEV